MKLIWKKVRDFLPETNLSNLTNKGSLSIMKNKSVLFFVNEGITYLYIKIGLEIERLQFDNTISARTRLMHELEETQKLEVINDAESMIVLDNYLQGTTISQERGSIIEATPFSSIFEFGGSGRNQLSLHDFSRGCKYKLKL